MIQATTSSVVLTCFGPDVKGSYSDPLVLSVSFVVPIKDFVYSLICIFPFFISC